MRQALLTTLYRLFPFDLHGDCDLLPSCDQVRISCVINFYGRLDLLTGILHSLMQQNYDRRRFEVILVEDRNGTEAGKALAADFGAYLPIRYVPLEANFGMMGYSRNVGLAHSRGEIVLFLDDDTVILQKDFLSELDRAFLERLDIDAVVPHGQASFGLIDGRYAFHDPYFMTSRCTAYRRDVLRELRGFVADFVGQEDVEFVIRFSLAGKQCLPTDRLRYFHPPLLVPNTRKPRAVGFSFFGLKKRYSTPIWLLVLANCSRHAPLLLLPVRRFREQARFGLGFLLGVLDGLRNRMGQSYQ